MAMRVEVYTSTGRASGQVGDAADGDLRDLLATKAQLLLVGVTWQGLGDPPRPAEALSFAVDDIVFALAPGELNAPVHAAWHHVVLHAGPYVLEGDLATMPGFDPGRSLARPSGDFVLLRDVRVALVERPDSAIAVGDHALVNRYVVERIAADLMLAFFFPGAVTATESLTTTTAGRGTGEAVGGLV
jgi:hypothetical protein